jgi:hypothetical protein
VARVRAQLALGGWPLADPHSRQSFRTTCRHVCPGSSKGTSPAQSSVRPSSSSMRARRDCIAASAPYSVGM